MDKNNDMEKIYEYIRQHATRPSEALSWVEKQTHIRTNHARMLSGAVQGQILRLLVQTSRATRILELGTFTGYSAICLASALPEGGHLDTLEINDELEDLILEGFERAGLDDKIELHIGDCKETLVRLRSEMGLDDNCSDGPADKLYDIVFIDANKRQYCEYLDLVLPHLNSGAYIIADNTLWDGHVVDPAYDNDPQTQGVRAFNDRIATDPQFEKIILPLRDGLTIVRWLK